jgi:hypothetical protein
MPDPLPDSPQSWGELGQKPVDETLILAAIAGVIQSARRQGQSWDDLNAQVLADDSLLDRATRQSLSEILQQAWDCWHD